LPWPGAECSGPPQDEPLLQRRAQELREALNDLDESAAQSALDSAFAEFAPEIVLSNLVLPYLHELGERWASGDASVGQEHFASQLLRGRLLGLARGWGRGARSGARPIFVLPYRHELGERWASGDASVGQEHFASQLLRGRLLGLARGWDRGA